MSKTILGLDLGSNSIGWALLSATADGQPKGIIDAGVRIFQMAVEDKTPTPKNQKRREKRLARRTLERRARRKLKLGNKLMAMQLLPKELVECDKPESVLNSLGDPYQLRAKALDEKLAPHELGRVLLHLVQRRGFLSNRKTLLGRDMLDDPDVLAVLSEVDEDENDAELTEFKQDIAQLKEKIFKAGCRTLGEYFSTLPLHSCKRNRSGEHLRTDRQLYHDEFSLIIERQKKHYSCLTPETIDYIEHTIFHQRPLKLKKDRVGKCSLEIRNKRTAVARLEFQRFRYLQDVNNLAYLDVYENKWLTLSQDKRDALSAELDSTAVITYPKIRSLLGFDRKTEFNLEASKKNIRGNTTAAIIQKELPNWKGLSGEQQLALVEDLISIKKKSALKTRLMTHWKLDGESAVKLCLVELEPEHGNLSLKAINKLLPHLQKGQIYSDARISAGYGYEQNTLADKDRLGLPPELHNPIVNKALHEVRRVVNGIIATHGKPSVIRIEMARDLEMNTSRYKAHAKQQKENEKANSKAVEVYQQVSKEQPKLALSNYPSRDQKIRYRLWKDQGCCCIYSGKQISLGLLFSAAVEVDHILPYSQSLDDSYMNKVVCLANENQAKGNRTPIDAFGGSNEIWEQISQRISHWHRGLSSKRERFYRTEQDMSERDFIERQLNDTRYISTETADYLKVLGADITFTRGVMTSWLRHQWELNDLLGTTSLKERSDHRHHMIDALVTACIDRNLYLTLKRTAQDLEREQSQLSMKDIYISPPLNDVKTKLEEKLNGVIVSHAAQRKITGALHEDTGVGFIEGIGTVYRVRLDSYFSGVKADKLADRAGKILDETVRGRVLAHLLEHNNSPKQAFAEGVTVYQRDGKTPIKRVRVVQSKVTLEKLRKNKFGLKDRNGEVFKWVAYGNIHSVVITRDSETSKVSCNFVTTMEAAQGALRKGDQTSKYLMTLHKNDLVSVKLGDHRQVYRVQALEQDSSRLKLRLHTAATSKNNNELIRKPISALISDYAMEKIEVNAIGKIRNVKAGSGYK